MTKELSAYQFWKRVDEIRERRGFTLEQIASMVGVKHQSIRDQRSKDLIPKSETVYKIAKRLNASMEYLLAGETEIRYSPRVNAIANYLETNPEKLDAIEILLFEKSVGQSSRFS